MNSIAYKIFLVSMIEIMFNNKTETDLGDYLLEYKTEFSKIYMGDMRLEDACLAVATRLVNKKTGLVEYGNVFFKILIRSCDVLDELEKLNFMWTQLLNSTPNEKMSFILRPERKILKTPYVRNGYIDPVLATFFNNLQDNKGDWPVLRLGGKFPKEAIPSLDVAFVNALKLNEDLQKNEESNGVKR